MNNTLSDLQKNIIWSVSMFLLTLSPGNVTIMTISMIIKQNKRLQSYNKKHYKNYNDTNYPK